MSIKERMLLVAERLEKATNDKDYDHLFDVLEGIEDEISEIRHDLSFHIDSKNIKPETEPMPY